jgi:hypothetical protein
MVVFPLERQLTGVQDFLTLVLGLSAVVGVAALVYPSSIFFLWRVVGCPDGFESRIVGAARDFWHKAADASRGS